MLNVIFSLTSFRFYSFLKEASGLSPLFISPSSIFCLSPLCPVPGKMTPTNTTTWAFLPSGFWVGLVHGRQCQKMKGERREMLSYFPPPPHPSCSALGGGLSLLDHSCIWEGWSSASALQLPLPSNTPLPMIPFPPYALQSSKL